MSEPIGRFAAVHTINRGLHEAPVLRQGLAVTWRLAAIGATGRVVVPILLQQAIDRGSSPPRACRSGWSPCCAIGAVALLIAGIAQRQAVVRLGQRSEQALYELRTRLISHIHRISLADHNEERRGALVARVTSDIETLAQFFQWGGLAWLLDGPLMLMVPPSCWPTTGPSPSSPSPWPPRWRSCCGPSSATSSQPTNGHGSATARCWRPSPRS